MIKSDYQSCSTIVYELLLEEGYDVKADDAMFNHYLDIDRRFVIVEALKCEQAVLGIIGDFIIHTDVVFLSFTYTEAENGYRISIRSCHEDYAANEIAAYVCREIGNGGGHLKKAGGYIQQEKMENKYGKMTIFDVVNSLLCEYIDSKY